LAALQVKSPAFLSGENRMNERIRQFNWNESPLGAVEGWKQSLRSALGICLNSNFPIAIYWGEQLILLYNDAWSPIPGNKHPWALGRSAREVWPEIWNDIEPQFAKAFSGEAGGSKDALLAMQRHGYIEECYFDFTFTPVFGEDGKVDGIFNAVIETTFGVIHERRSGLLQNLARKIISLSNSGEVFKKVNAILKKKSADISFCFSYSLSDGDPDPMLVASTAPDTILNNLPLADLIKNGTSIYTNDLPHFMDRIPLAHWPEQPTEGVFIPFKANNGRVTGFLFAGLSARRRYDRDYQIFVESLASTINAALNTIQSLEEERNRSELIETARIRLSESEAKFRSLTQALPQLVWVTDAEGRQEFVTDRWKEYTGLDPLNASTWAQILHPEDEQIIAETWGSSLQTGNTYKAEARIKGKDGNYRWFFVHGEPIRNEKKEIIKWVGAFTDIHEQKQAEALLRHSEEKLEFLVKKRTEELERSNEDLQQFAHVASHDMKEPLRKIKVFSELLSDEFNNQLNNQAKLYLSKIQNASDRMLTMMDSVLQYAGMDAFPQGMKTIDLNDIMQSVEADLEMVIQKKNATIKRDTLPGIEGYPVLIYQLFYNLVSNALKFSKREIPPVIELLSYEELHKGRIFFRIKISDNGIGFEQRDAERIFHSFARLNPMGEYEGTGLGLSLCKKIAIRHQGLLSALGKPGLGAEFSILLPRYQEKQGE
jgi:PAS domain S-box-containing protein